MAIMISQLGRVCGSRESVENGMKPRFKFVRNQTKNHHPTCSWQNIACAIKIPRMSERFEESHILATFHDRLRTTLSARGCKQNRETVRTKDAKALVG